ncbi:MAG TPA: MoxR family ATPase [Bryobacteraceae bacterium]|jgi:MoxR-like ATPase|nr:MAG: MoxR family ATPase [Deltaproteobacteria bacterium]HMJ60581.1 MoxR family ATPase [Bryobacteraceae bacterium]
MSEEQISVDVLNIGRAVQAELQRVIYGQAAAIQSLLVAITAGGHVLIEGVPGVAKTLLARSLAAALRCRFSRIQFTPDLMPSDITGVNVFDLAAHEFRFRPGPLFADIVLADEINRAPAKTQAALLEAMQEHQVSIDGQTHELSTCFTVVATQNPIEYEGTYPLPEAQLDRFLMKVIIDYPGEEDERAMLKSAQMLGEKSAQPHSVIQTIVGPQEIARLRAMMHAVRVDETVLEYALRLIRQSRGFPSLTLGASPRAAIMLLQAAKALALLRGHDYVTPDEIQLMALPVLRHRVRLTPEAEIEGLTPDGCIQSLLAQVEIPR